MISLRVRTLLAEWTSRVVIAGGTIGLIGWIVATTWRGATNSVWSLLFFGFVTVIGLVTGFFLSATLGGLLIAAPLFGWLARMNGAPFAKDDRVVVLVGQHRGTVTRVYDVWPTRHQVLVELGDGPKKAVRDVFCWHEVCRVS